MMKEIKFRAWSRVHKIMAKVIEIRQFNMFVLKDKTTLKLHAFTLPDLDVMQYSGLMDAEGRKIYEGDIFGGGYLYTCYLENGSFIVKSKDGSNKYLFQYLNEQGMARCELKIIGNIYENPELTI